MVCLWLVVTALIVFMSPVGVSAKQPVPHSWRDLYGLPPIPADNFVRQDARASPATVFGEVNFSFTSYALPSGQIDVALKDTLAFCTMFDGVQIVRVSDSSAPDSIGGIYLQEGWVTDIVVQGNYLYVTMWGGAFYIIDVTDPAHPTIAGRYETSASAYGVDVAGGRAYVAFGLYSGARGLLVLDISDLADIKLISLVPPPNDYLVPLKVKVSGNYVFVVGGGFVWVVDALKDSTLTLVPTGYFPVDLDISGSTLVLADIDPVGDPPSSSALTVVDITADPLQLVIRSQRQLPGTVGGVALSGDTAFVANGRGGMIIFSIADHSHPDSLGTYRTGGFVGKVAISGTTAFVVDYGPQLANDGVDLKLTVPRPGDFQVVAVSNAGAPVLTGVYQFPGMVTGVVTADSTAYALNNSGIGASVTALKIPDMIVVGEYTAGSRVQNAFAVDSLLCLATDAGLEIVDFSDQDAPRLVATDSAALGAADVVVRDGCVFIATANGLRIDRIGDQFALQNVTTVATPRAAVSVVLFGKYAYVALLDVIVSIDIADLEHPFIANQFGQDRSLYNGLAVGTARLYAKTTFGFDVFDASALPENPPYLGGYNGAMWCYDIKVAEPYVIMADGWNGLRTFKTSDSVLIQEVGGYNTPGFCGAIALNGHDALVADYFSLIALQHDLPTDADPDGNPLPKWFALRQNYPNPFNPITTIEYNIPRGQHVRLAVYNILGQEVVRLVDGYEPAGSHSVQWNGQDAHDQTMASGIYFYRLATPNLTETKKMVLLK